ncbi:hypothetical protein JOD67_003522 [Tenggerimyces flavus]|nr:hypothetical protein [Tenggerimyces flavus]
MKGTFIQTSAVPLASVPLTAVIMNVIMKPEWSYAPVWLHDHVHDHGAGRALLWMKGTFIQTYWMKVPFMQSGQRAMGPGIAWR